MKKKILILLSLFIFSLAFLMNKVEAEDYYKIGTHLEAENYNVNKLKVITNNSNASGYKALDAGSTGTVTYEVNIETAGTYRLALGYYSGGIKGQAAIKLKVNDAPEQKLSITAYNGWCQDTNRLPVAMDVEVELNAGKNTIVYGAAGEYVNLDYIAIFNLDSPYEAEEMYAHLQADGSRIQAEWSIDVAGGYCDNNIRIADKGKQSDGFTLSLDDDKGSKAGYKVYAETAGTYIFQVAFYGSNNTTPTYLFNINGTNKNVTLPICPANWNRDNYSSKAQFEVELNEGENIIYYSYIGSGFADFDWFKIFKKETNKVGDIIEAEDYILGDVNAQKSNEMYPFVSGYAVELAQGSINFEIEAETAGEYTLYVSSYTETQNAFNNISINGIKSKLVYSNPNGWIDNVSSASLTEFMINLNEGINSIVITKGEDTLAYNYVDIDFLAVSKGKVSTNKVVLNEHENPEVELSSLITVEEYETIVLNEEVVKIENGKIVIVSGGTTKIEVSYEINNVKVKKIIPVEVSKMEYKGNDIKALDTTKTYSAGNYSVDVEMPEGWTCTQSGASNEVGVYEVTVTFTHPNYNSVVKTATLTITKGIYTGNELFVQNAEYKYDGDEKYIIASAPHGWNISYENNGQTEKGEYEVTVIFSHKNYEDVVKTVKLTIVGSGCSGSIVASMMSISLLGAAIVLLRKRKNMN